MYSTLKIPAERADQRETTTEGSNITRQRTPIKSDSS